MGVAMGSERMLGRTGRVAVRCVGLLSVMSSGLVARMPGGRFRRVRQRGQACVARICGLGRMRVLRCSTEILVDINLCKLSHRVPCVSLFGGREIILQRHFRPRVIDSRASRVTQRPLKKSLKPRVIPQPLEPHVISMPGIP